MDRFKILVIIVVALFACCNVYKIGNSIALSDIAKANVEALADPEWINGKGWVCYQYVEDDLSQNHYTVVVFCGDCSSYAATYYKNSHYCTYSGMYNK